MSCFQSHLFGFLWKRCCPKTSLSCSFLAQVMFAIDESLFPLTAISCQFYSGLIPFTFGDVPLNEVVITGKNGIYRFSNPNSKNSKTPKTNYQNNQKGVMCDIFNLTFTRFQFTRAESNAWYPGITSSSGSLGNLPSYSQVHVFFSSRWSHSSGLRQKMFGSTYQQRWQL